jgi:hypothetical protein
MLASRAPEDHPVGVIEQARSVVVSELTRDRTMRAARPGGTLVGVVVMRAPGSV